MYSKTHKVDVVSGYNFPNDQHALWFDSATNQLKRFDGGKWVSGSAIDSREESDEQNFINTVTTGLRHVIWQGALVGGSNSEVLQDADLQYYLPGTEITIGINKEECTAVIQNDYSCDIEGLGGLTINDNQLIFTVKNGIEADTGLIIVIPEQTTTEYTWNPIDNFKIAMPRISWKSDPIRAYLDVIPEGKAYYFPYGNKLIPVLITRIQDNGRLGIEGECVALANIDIDPEINNSLSEHDYYLVIDGGKGYSVEICDTQL